MDNLLELHNKTPVWNEGIGKHLTSLMKENLLRLL
jgi:hypothetical protein